MNTEILIQAIINGIMVGGIYAMIGMSLNMIFGVMKIVNFCQGELLMVSMYITYLFYSELGMEPFVAIPLVAVIMFGVGALIQSTMITRSIKEDGDQNVLFLTCCLGIFLSNTALLLFKSDYRTAESVFSNKVVSLGSMNISVPKLLGFVALCVTTVLIFLMLYIQKSVSRSVLPHRMRSEHRLQESEPKWMIKSWQLAALAAASTSSSLASGFPMRMFSRMDLSKRKLSWAT